MGEQWEVFRQGGRGVPVGGRPRQPGAAAVQQGAAEPAVRAVLHAHHHAERAARVQFQGEAVFLQSKTA